jgi:DNA-binding NarL/FixJ family response regulator
VTAPAPTLVYVVEDHAVVREGLCMLLRAVEGLSVVGASASASAALADLRRLRPDVVLLDLDLGSEDGLEWLPRILAAAPRSRVLILTALRDAGRDVAALHAGARGFVHKDASSDGLLRAIKAVAAGELCFDPAVLAPLAAAPVAGPAAPALAGLTARELDLVRLVGEGLRNEEIARRLGITEKTVRNHLTAVFDKVGASGRLELAVFAYRHGLARVGRGFP